MDKEDAVIEFDVIEVRSLRVGMRRNSLNQQLSKFFDGPRRIIPGVFNVKRVVESQQRQSLHAYSLDVPKALSALHRSPEIRMNVLYEPHHKS